MINKILVVKDSLNSDFGEAIEAKLPVGSLIALQKTAQDQNSEEVQASIGVWESSPGKFKRHVANREFSHIVKGCCTFTPEGGEAIELCAGDAVLFPANCEGVWDIKEDFRKTYCIF
ncbi:cupin domain-containing protein [Acinetobacter pseudolwoffii]|uniref:cupin domain-containing protein n=1 Tax=Acinetobacter pseudolwoffii TaxID=2053287 RepID=UPI002468F4F9|nr:cupin domain-containing protein [Acinetobacter pseudolwoffii]MDH5818685.1 cupin domain-containing protein [Acinetobacter pseudolwoffii]